MKQFACFLGVTLIALAGTDSAQAQMHWWPTEISATSGVWVAEGDMQDVVESAAFGAHVGWMTRATNGWAAFFGGVEHGGFVGMHRIGSSLYGWQPQLGWTLRTGQTRLVGWSFSTGLAYNSRVYNPEEPNPDLVAVGSHLNGLIRLGITVANDSPISLGLGILHTSNGGLRRPNKGINTPHAKLIVRVAETPRRKVYMDGADPRQWRHAVGLGIGGRDHGAYGGHVYGVQELFAQSTYVLSPRHGVTAQAALVHHGALRADDNTDAPSDSEATNPLDRLQPGLSAGWSWLFGRARLDLIKGGVFLHPTPGFSKGYNKAQVFLSVHSALDVFVSLRFTDWRADYVSAGVALRWGTSERECNTCPKWDL
tara:strand:- start:4570 stop:5673 length:1104 start_codon:yes stop_codon:yes gene_type:complete